MTDLYDYIAQWATPPAMSAVAFVVAVLLRDIYFKD